MKIWILIGIALLVLFVWWRLNIRASGSWVDLPSNPYAFVDPKYAPLVEWLAKEAEAQIGRGHNIAGNSITMGTLNEAVEQALADRSGDGQIEISIPDFIGDADGMYGFSVTLDQQQLEQFNL